MARLLRRRPPVAALVGAAGGALAAALLASCAVSTGGGPARPTVAPPVRHVFVVDLENRGYAAAFGPGSPAPYLSRRLTAQGQLLTRYYATAHDSLPNYVAQISGQGPNPQTQADCRVYSRFVRTGTVTPQQAVGEGCVYPRTVRTVADQLDAHHLTWRGYMEDMGTPCRHPALGTADRTQRARVGNQYAARHDPFVYFASITGTAGCARHVVDLSRLAADLASVRTTPNLGYIVPNLCNDGHDSPCVDGRPGGLVTADTWLRTWVPRILASPAYRKDGLLVVTFDEAGNSAAGCCGEGPGPNAPLPGGYGFGGGRTGAVVLSPFVAPGGRNDTPYNHYSLLRTVEDVFGLAPLGYARDAHGFGPDVFTGT